MVNFGGPSSTRLHKEERTACTISDGVQSACVGVGKQYFEYQKVKIYNSKIITKSRATQGKSYPIF